MTCVVGIATPGKGSLVAFDSLSGSNGTYSIRRDPKGAKLSPWLALGYTTSYRFGQIITHHVTVGAKPDDPYDWAVREFVPEIRKALKEHGWLKTESGREESGDVILAVRDRVLTVHSDFQVSETTTGYTACGSGEYHANGALYVLSSGTPRRRAVSALEAAEAGSVWVRRPWHVIEVRA